jgi:hypothetical protein
MAWHFDVRYTGIGQVQRRLPSTWQKYSDEAGTQLYKEGVAVLQLARVLAPVRTGFLRRSGAVFKHPLASGKGHWVTVVFRAPYAMVVHETHPTRAKFLEQAYRMLVVGMKARLESNTARAVK